MFRSILILALGLATGGIARAETVNCTNITTLPAVIATQGVYCLKQNLATGINEGYALEIRAGNVTLDCNGFKIGGLGAGPGTRAWGIYSHNTTGNLTVRNCNVRGFATGIGLYGSMDGRSGDVVAGNRLDGNTLRALDIQSNAAQVTDNMITATGGSTYYGEPGYPATAIQVIDDVDVIGNTIWGVIPVAGGVRSIGIYVTGNAGGSVQGNRIRGLGGAGAEGVYAGLANSRVRIVGNSIAGPGAGLGVRCSASTSAVAVGNHFSGFATNVDVCLNGGSNLNIP